MANDIHQCMFHRQFYRSLMVDVSRKQNAFDRDGVIGSAKVIKGKVKGAVDKATGDAKLETEGKADKLEGDVQNEFWRCEGRAPGRVDLAKRQGCACRTPGASEHSIQPW